MRSAALLLCLASAGLRRFEQLKRSAEESDGAAPELSKEVLTALIAKINVIDDQVGELQEAVDNSSQNIFRIEMMAQNNRLNITGELGSLAESSIVVGKNALRLARISESAGVVNSSLLNQLDILATAHERALNASTFIESHVGEGGTFSEPGMENLTTLLGEARSAYERIDLHRVARRRRGDLLGARNGEPHHALGRGAFCLRTHGRSSAGRFART